MSPPTSVDRVIEAENEGATVTVRLAGHLDAVAGPALLDTLRTELDRGPHRVDIDLSSLQDFTPEGLEALASCADIATGLPGGLHYRTEGGPGQAAVLAAFALHPELDEEE